MSQLARSLPPLNALLERRSVRGLHRRLRRELVTELARELLAEEREFLRRGRGVAARYGDAHPDRAALLRFVEGRLLKRVERLLQPKLRTVINATGVLLHTNLGRAPLSAAVTAELQRVSSRPVSLEIDLERGKRGRRHDRIEQWLRLLSGAEAGLVVNNNAAALWLAVQGLAKRRRALISRGEQVAIGGSFRMPDLLRSTDARIVEVGTTNRTRVSDYEKELREGDVVLKVHPSNYRIEGFAEEVSLEDLAALCARAGASLVFDAGSGSLYNFGEFGLAGEQTVGEALRAGVDVVTFSGDKLLGGPQAGLLVGKRPLIDKLARHPMMRALRVDKLILAALEATLAAYAAPGRRPDLPLFDALSLPQASLRRRAKTLAERLQKALPRDWTVTTARAPGAIGGGSFAQHPVPGMEVAVCAPTEGATERLHSALRRGEPAILTRIGGGAVRIDVRTPGEEELGVIAERIVALSRGEVLSP